MNGELRSLINRLTQDIIDSFNIQVPIIDMAEVVRLLGGSVEATPNVCDRAEGSIRKLDNSFVIYVSTFQTKERRQFTIAHELGHLFLHMGYLINEDLWARQTDAVYYRTGDSLKEYQANEFAAALLMPKKI